MQRDNISSIVQLLLIRIEFGPLAFLIPIALHLFSDSMILGLEKARLDISSTVFFCIISDATSKTETPELLSEITSFPPLLSSDIALSIFIVNVLLFMRHFIIYLKKQMVISLKKEFLILIYEKEKLLNSILDYQISKYNNFKSFCFNNSEDLFSCKQKKNLIVVF